MFKNLFKKKVLPRDLNSPRQLRAGDILELKPRSILPDDLQGVSLTVKKIQAYQYSDGLYTEFVLETSTGSIITMMCSPEEEEDSLSFSRELKKSEVEQLFNSDELAELWEEGSASLKVNREAIAELSSWLPDSYRQEITSAIAYFFTDDQREKGVSNDDDDSEQLQYHECEGSENQFSLTVEVWQDGSTDFYAQVTVPFSIIAEMWPNAS